MKKKNIQIKCPQCKTQFEYYSSKFRPFCCEKCRMIDLGKWFNEEYNIPSSSPELDDFNEFDIPTDDPFGEDNE